MVRNPKIRRKEIIATIAQIDFEIQELQDQLRDLKATIRNKTVAKQLLQEELQELRRRN